MPANADTSLWPLHLALVAVISIGIARTWYLVKEKKRRKQEKQKHESDMKRIRAEVRAKNRK